MNNYPLLSTLLLSALCVTPVCVAQNPDKMTYEKALKSDRETFHHKTIPLQETIDTWDKYVKAPDESDSGSNSVEMVYTPLWSSPMSNGSVSGSFTLSDSFRHYDEIVVIAGYSGKRYTQHFRFTPREYDDAVLRWGQAVIWEREREIISGRFSNDNRTFTRMISTGYIYKIYGVSFE